MVHTYTYSWPIDAVHGTQIYHAPKLAAMLVSVKSGIITVKMHCTSEDLIYLAVIYFLFYYFNYTSILLQMAKKILLAL